MSTHDKARRAFLIQTAAGVGAAAATIIPEGSAEAQTAAKTTAPAAAAATTPPVPKTMKGEGAGAFLSIENAQTVAAIAERIMPGAPGKPGATDLGVINYIDLALAGAYSPLQEFYRHGLNQLEAYSQATYKMTFVDLSSEKQDEVLTALQQGKATGFDWPSAKDFFDTLRTHTMEGMFADPIYGGNKNYGGWVLVGFPGSQALFTKDDMESSGAFTREPIVGLQS